MAVDESIRGVIFDFGGVMTESPFDRYANIDPRYKEVLEFFLAETFSIYHLTTAVHDFHRYEIGEMSPEELFHRICERFVAAGHTPVDPDDARNAVWTWEAVACTAMMDAARQVREAGYRTALLTNAGTDGFLIREKALGSHDLFDVVTDSSVVGLRKPDPAIYELTCVRLGIPPPECIFIDDLECNVDAAVQLGMAVIHCTSPVEAADLLVQRLLGRSATAEP